MRKNWGLLTSRPKSRELKAAGKLPTLDEVLDAVADARQQFAVKIVKARLQCVKSEPQ
jgi:hypothetical protein